MPRIRFVRVVVGLLAVTLGACNMRGVPAARRVPPGTVRELARDLVLPYQVAVDGDYVYWVNSGTQISPEGNVMRIPKKGGKAEVLAANLDFPQGMVVDDHAVYWINTGHFAGTGQLMRVAKAGGEPVTMVTGLNFAVQLVADADYLYFEDGISVQRISKQGGQPQVLVDSGTPVLSIGTGIAIDDQRIYFEFSQQFGSFSICSVAKTGGAITTIGTVNTLIPPSTYLAVDDTYVYWAGEVDDTIRRAPKAGGESIALVSGLVTPSATGFFVTDSNLFYFAQQCGSYLIEDGVRVCSTPGGVYFVDRNGGGRHTVIEDDTGYVGVAVDDAAVYVTNQFNGTLKSIAK